MDNIIKIPTRIGDELMEYFNLNREDVTKKLITTNNPIEEEIKTYTNNGKTNYTKFYKKSKNYIFELTVWNNCKFKKMILGETIKVIAKENFTNVLDFGSGIGSDSMAMYHFNLNPTMCDFDSEVSKFAKWKCKKYNMYIPFLDVEKFPKNTKEKFEAIICFDVLEHCPDIKKIIKNFNKVLIDDGYLFLTIRFGEGNILHLNKYKNYKDTFEKILKENGFNTIFTCNDYYILKKGEINETDFSS